LTPAPQPLGFGVTMVGPVMDRLRPREQKKHFLRGSPILTIGGARVFEPEPAPTSPRCALRPKRDGDPMSSTGKKTWTTLAQLPIGSSVWCGPTRQAKKQEGISFC